MKSLATGLLLTVLAGTVACTEPPDAPALPPPDDGDEAPPPPPGTESPAPATRFFRLTRVQWENAVKDLLRLEAPTGFSSELAEDALPAGFLFDNPGGSLSVDSTQWAAFARASAAAAALVTTDASLLARIVPVSDGDEAARARAFVEDFGLRAQRRPLSVAEVDRYLAVHEAGRSLYTGVDPFVAGVRLVIEAMLQSPLFLYRVEQSATVVDDVIPLDGFEVASRLSFSLWNTMPDDELFLAAADGGLDGPAGVELHARRLLDDPRATATVQHFFTQLLETEKLEGIAPSTQLFPDIPVDFAALARAEAELFLAHIFTSGGGVSELLTSTTTFANVDTARVYGLQGVEGEELSQVELDPAERRGVFTHVAFLAQNASSRDPDPIHRGVFLARQMVCIPISAPPNDIPPLPPPGDFETNRQRVSRHTEAEGSICADCHAYNINPFGFPFEMYDATGAVRATDNGLPIDTNTEVPLDDLVPVRNALELVDAMAQSQVVHDCAAQHWLEFSLGRPRASEDDPLITRLGTGSLEGSSMKELLVELVTSPAFLARSAVELGGAP